MNSEHFFYAALATAGLLGFMIAARKQKDSEVRVVRPWLLGSFSISVIFCLFMAIITSFTAPRMPWTTKDFIGAILGFGLVLQCVLTISGIILAGMRLILISSEAKKNINA